MRRWSYYQENYRRAVNEQRLAEREGDFIRAEACRKAAVRWLEMEQRAGNGEPEDEQE